MAYPREYGHKNRALPDMATPLNIEHGKPDDVPDNDMAEVARSIGEGGQPPDPLMLVSVIQKKAK